ncbi:hypothetical protein Ptr902_01965 [Pyrenophora tritici-repentis]|nr:hypothetical protein Ptr902_01965 [Pyrenophora tritici-repentis]
MAAVAQAGLTITTLSSGSGLPIDSNWPPLTTPFTPPAGCTDHWIAIGREGDNSVSMLQPSTCTPDATSIHSPGTCMDGYYVARIVEYRTAGYKPGDDRLWGANCCRNDMTSSGEFAICTSYYNTPITAYKRRTYVYTNDVISTSVYTAAYDNTTVYSVGNMYMPPFVVLWQASDLSKFDVDYASSLAAHLTLDFTPTPTAGVTPATASPPS